VKKANKKPAIAIVGIACKFPKADDASAYWSNLKNGVDAITEIPKTHWSSADYFDADPKAADKVYAQRGGFLTPFPFDPLEFGMAPKDIEATDTSQLFGLVVAKEALADAGYDKREFNRERTGVILGVTGTLELVIPLGARLGHPRWRKAMQDAGIDASAAEDAMARISDSYVGWQENSFPGLLGNVVAGRIANKLDLHGTNCVVDAACASSLSAVHLAALELQTGRADMIITGGVDTFNDIFMYTCFSKTPALSPTGNAKPFDASGDGTILGEGIGMIVLKRVEDAERDGDKIYAVLKGLGSSSDGKGTAIYEPSAAGQGRALRNAYSEADVAPNTVELVEAHGTGTKVGDAIEATALSEVYRDAKEDGTWCALGSLKSMIGHTKAAAGAAGLIKVALALKNKTLPATIKVDQPNDKVAPGQSPFYINTQMRPWLGQDEHPRRGAISALGFGGSNFHCVLEEYQPQKAAADWDGQVQILALCGKDKSAVEAALKALPDGSDWLELRGAAQASRAAFKGNAACRLLLSIESGEDFEKKRTTARKLLAGSQTQWSTPDGIYFGSGPKDGKLAFVFPGQGSQHVGMLRELACQFPEMLDTLAEADAAFTEGSDQRLSDFIFPHPSFTEAAANENEAALRATQVAQPAIGTLSLGAARVLESFGLRPEAVCGHSYGELTALWAAGRYKPAALHELSQVRGKLMGEGKGDKGTMLAVQAPIKDVEEAIRAGGFDVVLANKNAPKQCVISGATAEIAKAASYLDDKGIRNKRLPVGAAFHSPLVADARKPFEKALKKIAFSKARLPVYANTTGAVYPESPAKARDLLAQQLAKPVEFVKMIQQMYADGVRTFLEVGPGGRLTGLVKAILEGESFTAAALDSQGARSGQNDLARALCFLAAGGYAPTLTAWDADFTPSVKAKPKFAIPLSGANYMAPKKARAPRKPTPSIATPQSPVAPTSAAPLPVGVPTADIAAVQQNLEALQRLQEQTAQLHAQFLQGQQATLAAMQAMMGQTPTALPGPMPLAPIAQPVAQPMAVPAAPVAVTPVAPEPVSVPVAAPAADTGKVEAALLEVVSEKTGYPVEMLNLDMGLDSDLGIDSIKRVEILSALQERMPEAPAVKPEQLGTLRTLRQVVEFLSTDLAPAATAPVAEAPVATGVASADVEAALLEVVSDKTGYPVEMLNLDMGLDSDLGIDSIKRVEILSALQERMPEAPAVKPEQLGTLRTLRQVVEYLGQGQPAPAAVPAATQSSTGLAPEKVETALLAVVSDKTGYPVEMLNLDMGLDSDLGIDSIKRVEILSALQERMPEAPAVKPEQLGTLRTLRQVVDYLAGAAAPVSAPVSKAKPAAASPVRVARKILTTTTLQDGRPAVTVEEEAPLWVTDDESGLAARVVERLRKRDLQAKLLPYGEWAGTEVPTALAGLIILAPERDADDAYVKNALFLLKRCAGALRTAGASGGALFATAARLDGAFGLSGLEKDLDPAAGALAGLAKTVAREWPEVNAKAFDIEGGYDDLDAAAEAVVEECLLAGPDEVGISAAGRKCLELVESPAPQSQDKPLQSDEVVIITGGARGVTAEAAVAIAKTFKPTLLLLGRSPAPTPEPEWLAPLKNEGEIKKALAQRAEEKLAPKDLEARYQQTAANREMLTNIARMERAGATVLYRSVNVRDPEAVKLLIEDIRRSEGPIRGLIHGAGVLADRVIEEKTEEQFDRVYGTKVGGLRALLGALGANSLKVLALFSSSTGRFGRSGQVDYAMANEVLNKFAQQQSRLRPDCRVVAINWGPWEGGMVTPSLRKLFESEGVGMIPLTRGADMLVGEITSPQPPAEVVILGEYGRADASVAVQATPAALKTVFEREISIKDHPFLRDHVIGGKAVLPMAVIVEWLAHAAMHGNPGLVFRGFDELRILKGVRIDGKERVAIRVAAGAVVREGEVYRVPVELYGAGDALHARGEILLADATEVAPKPAAMPKLKRFAGPARRVYREYLFHGEQLQGLRSVEGCAPDGIIGVSASAPAPSKWLKKPLRSRWVADPLALDVSFQMMIVWSFERHDAGSLPTFAQSYRQFCTSFPKDGVKIQVHVTKNGKHRALADIDFVDRSGELVARIEGYECVIDSSLNAAFKNTSLQAV
jgi:acyl transferase domain-containing protein/acyl carrier protein/NAD(P)-dependent dehydrogenase (short-subunit alcohol dehydrogenase family)